MKLWEWRWMKPCAGCAKARESERCGGRRQSSGSEIRFLSSPWRARPLSSISEISSVVRIRPRHPFRSHGSTCFNGMSQKREDAKRSILETLACVLHLHPKGFSHQFTWTLSLTPLLYTVEQMKELEGLHSNSSSKKHNKFKLQFKWKDDAFSPGKLCYYTYFGLLSSDK